MRVSEKQLHFPEAGLANSLVHTYSQGGAGGMTVGLVDLELEVPPFCTIQPYSQLPEQTPAGCEAESIINIYMPWNDLNICKLNSIELNPTVRPPAPLYK